MLSRVKLYASGVAIVAASASLPIEAQAFNLVEKCESSVIIDANGNEVPGSTIWKCVWYILPGDGSPGGGIGGGGGGGAPAPDDDADESLNAARLDDKDTCPTSAARITVNGKT